MTGSGRRAAGQDYFLSMSSFFMSPMSPPSFFFDFLALPFFSAFSSFGASSARAIVHELGSNTARTKKHARINFVAFLLGWIRDRSLSVRARA